MIQAFLDCLFSIYKFSPEVMRAPSVVEYNNNIWESLTVLSRHPCASIQLAVSRLSGQLFSSFGMEDFSDQSSMDISTGEFLLDEPESRIRTLADGFFWQLRGKSVKEELMDQIVKNLLFLSRLVLQLSRNKRESISAQAENCCSLEWIAYQFSKVCKWEVSKNVKCTVKREGAFKWCAALALECTPEEINLFLPALMSYIHRELNSDNTQQESLPQLAREVCEVLKARLGIEQFSRELTTCQKDSAEKKIRRKRQRALEVIAEPEKAARRRIKKQLAKKEAKQKRIILEKPYKELFTERVL